MKPEFSVKVIGVGKVSVDRQDDGIGEDGKPQYFWDLFGEDGFCLNEGCPFWEKPTKQDVLDFFKENAE